MPSSARTCEVVRPARRIAALGVLFVTISGLSACGGSGQVLARVGTRPITSATVDHWVSVMADGPSAADRSSARPANTVHFACTVLFVTKLYLVLGEVLCLITPINMAANKKFTVKCERGAEDGDPGETVYWNEAGTQVNMGTEGLLTKEDPGTYQMSSEEGEGTFETTQNVELMA
jgi:hypothetical protein